jgi:hypothetical protein
MQNGYDGPTVDNQRRWAGHWLDYDCMPGDTDGQREVLMRAQVHATLALVAAIEALNVGRPSP